MTDDQLEHPQITSLDWGGGRDATMSTYDHVYAATAGGGPWDMEVSW